MKRQGASFKILKAATSRAIYLFILVVLNCLYLVYLYEVEETHLISQVSFANLYQRIFLDINEI